jgi:hypothetical protein
MLSNHQYGFRSESSTKLTSCHLIDEILIASNNKIPVEDIFYDPNKTFDCVNLALYYLN